MIILFCDTELNILNEPPDIHDRLNRDDTFNKSFQQYKQFKTNTFISVGSLILIDGGVIICDRPYGHDVSCINPTSLIYTIKCLLQTNYTRPALVINQPRMYHDMQDEYNFQLQLVSL